MTTIVPAFPSPHSFVSDQEFDFVIVGGGTAGLALAARLSEEPTFKVGVIEAGGYVPNDLNINVPGLFGCTLGNPSLDWSFFSEPQEHVNGRKIFHPRGKLLGGSSALNFMSITRASDREYDALEMLGNPGWNAESFRTYFRKSETIHPSPDAASASFIPQYHGFDGPLQLSHAKWHSDLDNLWFDELEKWGVKRNADTASGDNVGFYTITSAVDPNTATRSYSTNAYFEPVSARTNLVVLPHAQVLRVIISDDGGSENDVQATGVEFMCDGQKFQVKAKKEVVLAAGAFQTPQLLELSGIGNPSILSKHSISLKISLPSVGENLQDHIYVPSLFEVDSKLVTFDILADPVVAREMMELWKTKAEGPYSSTHSAFAFIPLKTFVAEPAERELLKEKLSTLNGVGGGGKRETLLKEWFDNEDSAQIELIHYPGFFPSPARSPTPGSRYLTIITTLMHPLSTGHVHISSPSPTAPPSIDPKYLSYDVEVDVLVKARNWVKEVCAKAKWVKSCEDVPCEGGDEASARQNLEPTYHPIGTASMLPREEGGVVDHELKVYGTTNLRVVDASVIPIHLSCHPTSTIYAIAEKAADIIKSTYRASG